MKMSVGFVEKGLSKFPLRRGNKGEDIYLFFEERAYPPQIYNRRL